MNSRMKGGTPPFMRGFNRSPAQPAVTLGF
jgi:hypothetical protein